MATRPTTQEKLRTSEQVVQSVRELAAGRTDSEIATSLNQRGLLSGRGRAFTAAARAWKRLQFQIDKPGSDPGFARRVGIRTDGSYSTSAKRRKIGSRDSHHPLLAKQFSPAVARRESLRGKREFWKLFKKPLTGLGGTGSRHKTSIRCVTKSAEYRLNKSN